MSVRNEKRKTSLIKKQTNRKFKQLKKKSTATQEFNFLLKVTYDGSTYGGYAKQKFSNTICFNIESALSKYFKKEIQTMEASRTDSKVHALDQNVSFKCNEKIDFPKFLKSINEMLPDSIFILSISEVPLTFHPQYACKNKTYRFKIHTKFNVFLHNYSYYWNANSKSTLTDLDIEKINSICSLFLGEHDFIGFSSSKRDTANTFRNINSFSFVRSDNSNYYFEINADGFLYNMIRILIPTILDWFVNKNSKEEILTILNSKDRQLSAPTISGSGLYLQKINY